MKNKFFIALLAISVAVSCAFGFTACDDNGGSGNASNGNNSSNSGSVDNNGANDGNSGNNESNSGNSGNNGTNDGNGSSDGSNGNNSDDTTKEPEKVTGSERLEYTLNYCQNLTEINFSGTVEQWNAAEKGYIWDRLTGEYTVHCKDGDIVKSEN